MSKCRQVYGFVVNADFIISLLFPPFMYHFYKKELRKHPYRLNYGARENLATFLFVLKIEITRKNAAVLTE